MFMSQLQHLHIVQLNSPSCWTSQSRWFSKFPEKKTDIIFQKGLRLEKTIQFFNLLLLSKAKIGGESKSKSRYHIDWKKKQDNGKNHFKVKGICFEEVNTMFIPQLRHLHIAQLNPPSYWTSQSRWFSKFSEKKQR